MWGVDLPGRAAVSVGRTSNADRHRWRTPAAIVSVDTSKPEAGVAAAAGRATPTWQPARAGALSCARQKLRGG
jgi:hypothetical protein